MRSLEAILDGIKAGKMSPLVMKEAEKAFDALSQEDKQKEMMKALDRLFGGLEKLKRRNGGNPTDEDALARPDPNDPDPMNSIDLWNGIKPFFSKKPDVKGFASYVKRPRFTGAMGKIVNGYKTKPGMYYWNHPEHSMYIPSGDVIYLSERSHTDWSPDVYKGTVIHELIHSTGHKSRLARPWLVTGMRQREQHLEEMIADMGMQMLMEENGILTSATKTWFDKHSHNYAGAFLEIEGRNISSVRHEAFPYAKEAAEYILNKPLTVNLAKYVRGFEYGQAA